MKQTNKILRSAAVVLTVMLAASSCNFLDETPYTVKTDQIATVLDGEMLVNRLYNSGLVETYESRGNGWHISRALYGGVLSGIFADPRGEAPFTGYANTMNFNDQTVGAETQVFYESAYRAIARANVVITRTPEIPGITESEKNSLVGQALFFRALNYYTLAKEYGVVDGSPVGGGLGGVPIFTEPVETADPIVTEQPRASLAAVYARIESDLKAVIDGNMLPNLPFYDNGAKVSKVTAQSLLAIVYLQWAGHPLKDTSKYALAAAMADAVITGGSGVALEESENDGTDLNDQKSAYNKIKNNESSKEIIYAFEYSQALSRSYPLINYSINDVYQNWYVTPGDKSSGLLSTSPTIDGMYNADRRLLYSYHADDVRGKPYNFYFDRYVENGNVYNTDEINSWFWFDAPAWRTSIGSSLNIPVFRLAEIYLVGAEAHLGNNNMAKAVQYVDVVRKRAFTVGGVTAVSYVTPTTVTISDILTERLHEMPFELKVWDDIRRTRLYPQVVAGEGSMTSVTDPAAPRDPYILEWKDIATSTTWGGRDANGQISRNLDALVWPFSEAIINRNKQLQQNPGFARKD